MFELLAGTDKAAEETKGQQHYIAVRLRRPFVPLRSDHNTYIRPLRIEFIHDAWPVFDGEC